MLKTVCLIDHHKRINSDIFFKGFQVIFLIKNGVYRSLNIKDCLKYKNVEIKRNKSVEYLTCKDGSKYEPGFHVIKNFRDCCKFYTHLCSKFPYETSLRIIEVLYASVMYNGIFFLDEINLEIPVVVCTKIVPTRLKYCKM